LKKGINKNKIFSKDSDNWEKKSKKILSHLFKMKGAYLFHVPVDPIKLGVKDYFEIIKSPMDFGTIKVYFYLR
jgi:hypothetical protein